MRSAADLLRCVLVTISLASSATVVRAQTAPQLPDGFRDEPVWDGLVRPTAVRFAPDGAVFVAEKSGIVKVYDSVLDPTPTVFADLRTNVHDFWDRGLLGLAVDPGWPVRPYVYVLYTHDALPGGSAPQWGDTCPSPPGATTDGCVVTGRLSRLTAGADGVMQGAEEVILGGWCQQYPSHSIADLAFGADGALYVSAGDGASFNFVDYGQGGGSLGSPTPPNPCGDPPGAVGDVLSPPSAEGGALRSQDILTAGDPLTYDGTVLRIDPDTGAALPDNPRYGGTVADDDRVVAHGLRNPFRMAFRPGTAELWIGDVGWGRVEELNRIADPTAAVVNFGWPCYEGDARQGGYDGADLALCEALYTTPGDVTPPYFAYDHDGQVVPGEVCSSGSSSISGVAFHPGGAYPAPWDGALFFADHSRGCVWALPTGTDGAPDAANPAPFAVDLKTVDLQIGPGGEIYYVDLIGGAVRRLAYDDGNRAPVALLDADPLGGPAPLTVTFDASASSDPDGAGPLAFDWDLDGDGAFGDAATATPSATYAPGTFVVAVRVTDEDGASDTAHVTVVVDDTRPVARIDTPLPGTTWQVGEVVPFGGGADDAQDGALPASALQWELLLHHCAPADPTDCHVHPVRTYDGVDGGTIDAPDHEYPSYLELTLTATDSAGLTDTVSLDLFPETVVLRLETVPSGLTAALNGIARPTPWERDVIVGSRNTIGVSTPQALAGETWFFAAWSDGGPSSHDIVAGERDATYTATFTAGCQDDPYEDNDTRATAAALPTDTDVATTVCADDADWYTFPATAGCAIEVAARFAQADGDLHLQLFDPGGAQVAASYSATDDEVVAATAPSSGAYAFQLYGFQGASNDATVRVTVACGPGVEAVCDDGLDDDGDGRVDCDDPDCGADAACVVPPEACDNGADDDGDGLADCDDPDCAEALACAPRETVCDDGLDDDGDGLVDCDDLDCAGAAGCPAACPADDAFEDNDAAATAYLLPGDGAVSGVLCALDDDWYGVGAPAGCVIALDLRFAHADGDLHMRLLGPDGVQLGGAYSATDDETIVATAEVAGVHAVHVYGFQGAENGYVLDVAVTCPGDVETACDDGADGDGDGLVDCADPDCDADAACVVLPETCEGGADEDRDGLVDCDDPDCDAAPACAPVETVCDDGLDGDGDGLVDCDDLDCAGAAGCAALCPADDAWEPNDFAAAAAPIAAGTPVDAVVCADDADWYAVEVAAGCAIDVDLLFVHAEGDLNLQLRGPDGTQIAAAYSGTDDEHVAAIAPATGAHAIHVYGFQGAQNGYGLLVTVSCP